MPAIDTAEKMARLIPRARLEMLERSRYFPFIEEREKFLNVVGEFLLEGS